jgi:hypothetical protein
MWVYDKQAKAWKKPPPTPALPVAAVLWDFKAKHPSHLSVLAGERVLLLAEPDVRGWVRVAIDRGGMQLQGVVPNSYIKIVDEAPPPSAGQMKIPAHAGGGVSPRGISRSATAIAPVAARPTPSSMSKRTQTVAVLGATPHRSSLDGHRNHRK